MRVALGLRERPPRAGRQPRRPILRARPGLAQLDGEPVFRHLRVDQHGDVALLRIDRPPANALDLELLEEGARVTEELAAATREAVVITGREGFFSAGVDLEARTPPSTTGGAAAGWSRDQPAVRRLVPFPRPVICAVNGHAIAGGLILALCGRPPRGHGRRRSLGLTEVRAGIPYPGAAIAIVRAELDPPERPAAGARRRSSCARRTPSRLGPVDGSDAPELVPRALELAATGRASARGTRANTSAARRDDCPRPEGESLRTGRIRSAAAGSGAETARASARHPRPRPGRPLTFRALAPRERVGHLLDPSRARAPAAAATAPEARPEPHGERCHVELGLPLLDAAHHGLRHGLGRAGCPRRAEASSPTPRTSRRRR